jgi:imidazolonepropionase-like amidohydrolase
MTRAQGRTLLAMPGLLSTRILQLALGAVLTGSGVAAAQPASSIALTHVTVIDPLTGPLPEMSVVIHGKRIVAVGPTTTIEVPPDSEIHDESGRFVVPGFWDAHVHLSQVGAAAFPLLVMNGITSVRDMGSDLTDVRRWQRARVNGQAVPRIVTPGPKLDDGSIFGRFFSWLTGSDTRVVNSPANARRVVDELKGSGVDFIKVHNINSPSVYEAIVDECRQQGLPFAGHIPSGVGPVGAAVAGQRTIEHGRGMLPCSPETWARIRSDGTSGRLATYCAAETLQPDVLPALRRAGTWFTPTLASWRGQKRIGDPALSDWLATLPGIDHVTPALRRHWAQMAGASPSALERELQSGFGALALAADQASVPVLAGTDLGDPYVVPGFALHDELQLLVEAGLSPLHALRSATLEPARALGFSDEVGAIQPGKVADLVVLDADPLVDIRNTRRIRAVVLDGRWFDARALEHLSAPE